MRTVEVISVADNHFPELGTYVCAFKDTNGNSFRVVGRGHSVEEATEKLHENTKQRQEGKI